MRKNFPARQPQHPYQPQPVQGPEHRLWVHRGQGGAAGHPRAGAEGVSPQYPGKKQAVPQLPPGEGLGQQSLLLQRAVGKGQPAQRQSLFPSGADHQPGQIAPGKGSLPRLLPKGRPFPQAFPLPEKGLLKAGKSWPGLSQNRDKPALLFPIAQSHALGSGEYPFKQAWLKNRLAFQVFAGPEEAAVPKACGGRPVQAGIIPSRRSPPPQQGQGLGQSFLGGSHPAAVHQGPGGSVQQPLLPEISGEGWQRHPGAVPQSLKKGGAVQQLSLQDVSFPAGGQRRCFLHSQSGENFPPLSRGKAGLLQHPPRGQAQSLPAQLRDGPDRVLTIKRHPPGVPGAVQIPAVQGQAPSGAEAPCQPVEIPAVPGQKVQPGNPVLQGPLQHPLGKGSRGGGQNPAAEGFQAIHGA